VIVFAPDFPPSPLYRVPATGGVATPLTTLDSAGGEIIQTADEPGLYAQIALSPDEKRVAVQLANSDRGGSDLWLLELASGIFSRLTFDPGPEMGPGTRETTG